MEVNTSTSESSNVAIKNPLRKSLPNHLTPTINPVNGKSEYFCTICQKSIRSRTQKYYHYGCCNDELKNYKCDKCAKTFSTRAHLNYHAESHNSNKYRCQHCDKMFSNRMVYQKHLKLHQRLILFSCLHCEKQFQNKNTLDAHTAKHKNELEFECSICLKKYATKSALEQHKLKHSAKKYECTHCGKFFQRNSILNLHLKRVKQMENYICDICSKKFADATTLQRHMKMHKKVGVTKYKCKQCDILTARKDNMQRHVRNMHTGQSFLECVEILSSESEQREDELAPNLQTNEHNLPKTVANSSVIKCVGNVEPVKVPTNTSQNSSESVVVQETIKENPPRHEKIKRKYDPIKMYRKILSTNEKDDDEQTEFSSNEERNENVQSTEKRIDNPRSTTSSISDFTATHWRKNYKNTYQHQEY